MMRGARWWVLATLATVMLPLEAAPQAVLGGEEHREVQLQDLRNQRLTLLALVEAMPEELLNDADNQGQRTFAQQIAHASVAFAIVTHRLFREGGGPYDAAPDAETRNYDKVTLVETVHDAFDAIEAIMAAQSEATRTRTVQFSGQDIPLWQVWDELREHAAWVGGQTVGNFRKHNLAPPAYRYLFPPEGS